MKIYKMQNCPHCEKVDYDFANQIGAEIIDVHSKEYEGFVPDQVPVLQATGITLMGPQQINSALNLIKIYGKKA